MIVFDLDDTLYKEADFVASGCRAIAAAAHEACPALSAADALEIIRSGDSTSAGFDALLAEIQRLSPGNPFGISELLRVYRFHKPDISLSPEVRDTLDMLQRAGVRMGLITDGRAATQRAKIQALGLEQYFMPSNIIISAEIGADKTTPTPFEEMMKRNTEHAAPDGLSDGKRHNLSANEDGQLVSGDHGFVYVGDNPAKDFLWPNRLGWKTFMLRDTTGRNIYPQTIPELSPDYAPQHEIRDLHDLIRLSD